MTNDDVVIVLRYARRNAKIQPYFWRQRSKILKECFPSFLLRERKKTITVLIIIRVLRLYIKYVKSFFEI
jgi:hypothetical protein